MHNEYFYTTKNIPKDIKIALMSDIHYHYPNYNLKILISLIKQLKSNIPDYICITGDILDTTACKNIQELINFLNEITRIAPTIVVLGNHDEKSKKNNKWQKVRNEELITSFKHIKNLHFLDDKTFTDKNNNITFYGFNFSFKHYEIDNETYESFEKEANKLNGTLPSNTYNVTLFHSPINIYNFIKNNPKHNLNKTDLILSGHMHNGCLPYFITRFLNKTFKTTRTLISPLRTFFPKNAQGKIPKIKDGYVHQGIIKFSKTSKPFNKLDYLYQKKVQFINIKKSS